jgi:hypothetical protein
VNKDVSIAGDLLPSLVVQSTSLYVFYKEVFCLYALRDAIFQFPFLFGCSSLSPTTAVLSLVTSRKARHGVVSV